MRSEFTKTMNITGDAISDAAGKTFLIGGDVGLEEARDACACGKSLVAGAVE